jgi:hypothetical protein
MMGMKTVVSVGASTPKAIVAILGVLTYHSLAATIFAPSWMDWGHEGEKSSGLHSELRVQVRGRKIQT